MGTSEPTGPTTARRPRQARGHRRVDAVLDAAAAIVAESGVDGATVGAIADRARTSKGSLYHFFPDREAILRAVAARHVAALRGMVDAIRGDARIDWRAIPPEEVVDRMLRPFRAYSAAHPDFQRLLRAPASVEGGYAPRTDVLAALIDLARTVLAARHPGAGPEETARRAAAVVGVIDGVSTTASRLDDAPRAALLDELPRILGAYLRTF